MNWLKRLFAARPGCSHDWKQVGESASTKTFRCRKCPAREVIPTGGVL